MEFTRLTLAALAGSVMIGGTARADLVGIVVVEDHFALDGTTPLASLVGYQGQRVLNVYAQFDDPTDRAVGVVGTPTNRFRVQTLGGTGFFNADLGLDVPPDPKLASVIASVNWDSFFTIGLKIGLGALIVAPETPGPNADPGRGPVSTNMAWTVPPTINGQPTPQSVAGPTGRVLLMRVTVQPGEDIEGYFGLLTFTSQGPQEQHVTFDSNLTGACCLSGTECLEELSVPECDSAAGVFLGSGSTCLPESCFGGCCFEDESGRRDCMVIAPEDCATLPGGVFLGRGVPCPISVIVTVVNDGEHFSHEVVVLSLCPNAGQSGCASGPVHIDPWRTTNAAAPVNCEDFGHPQACPIPAGFFGPGSDPFAETMCFEGMALGAVSLPGFDEPIDFGEADTLVRRLGEPFDRCELPSEQTRSIDVVLERLSLRAIEPITVTYDGGQRPELWEARMLVTGSSGQPGGTLLATKDHCNGGTFDSTLSACPTFGFLRISDGLPLDLDYCTTCDAKGIVMTSEDVPWVHDPEPGLALVTPVCSTFHPGVQAGRPIVDCDCNGNALRDECDLEEFTSRDCEGDGIPDECQEPYCQADANCDGQVHLDDLLMVVMSWECTTPPGPCPGDVNFDGTVDVLDLVMIALEWGPCPE